METLPWIYFSDQIHESKRDAVTALLYSAGILARPMPRESDGFGLVFLAGVDAAAITRIESASRRAIVLAVLFAPPVPPQQNIWSLLHAGASDVLVWRAQPENVNDIRSRLTRWHQVQELCESPRVRQTLVGGSTAWRSLLREVVGIAAFSRAPVLISGESGTGKELVARLIHDFDTRSGKREMVTVDCTTVTPELAGSELFGHERGAFTGAVSSRDGAFALADRGTLFLDEIGELPLTLQAQLLRVIQEGQYKRVGSNAWQESRFRLVCATNRDLEAQVVAGSFRADLYYRIAGCVCHTPRLHDRMDDVLVLAAHFQADLCGIEGATGFDETVQQYLLAREYPGNVRDLRRIVARLCQRHAGNGPITVGDVPNDERPQGEPRSAAHTDFKTVVRHALLSGKGLKEIGHVATEAAISIAMELEQGNLHRAAQRLGVTDRTLQLRRAGARADD